MAKEFSVAKEVFKTIAKTVIILVIIVIFAGLGFYVINPRLSAKLCAEIGWQKAEISCYELLYARNKDNADLYNLIVKLGNVDENQKQNEYIDKLQASEDYLSFCENMDKSVIDNFNEQKIDGEKLSLLYGTNEYITSREILNMLELGKYEEAYALAVASKQTDKAFELSVYNFAEYLFSKEISTEVKNNYFAQLKADFAEYLVNKSAGIDLGNSQADKIIKAYTTLKIEYTQYLIALQTQSDATLEYQSWQTALSEYNALI